MFHPLTGSSPCFTVNWLWPMSIEHSRNWEDSVQDILVWCCLMRCILLAWAEKQLARGGFSFALGKRSFRNVIVFVIVSSFQWNPRSDFFKPEKSYRPQRLHYRFLPVLHLRFQMNHLALLTQQVPHTMVFGKTRIFVFRKSFES